MPKYDEVTGRAYRTFGDTDPEPREQYEEPEDIKRYADAVDAMTPEEFAEHHRGLNAARQFEEMERERLH